MPYVYIKSIIYYCVFPLNQNMKAKATLSVQEEKTVLSLH